MASEGFSISQMIQAVIVAVSCLVTSCLLFTYLHNSMKYGFGRRVDRPIDPVFFGEVLPIAIIAAGTVIVIRILVPAKKLDCREGERER